MLSSDTIRQLPNVYPLDSWGPVIVYCSLETDQEFDSVDDFFDIVGDKPCFSITEGLHRYTRYSGCS